MRDAKSAPLMTLSYFFYLIHILGSTKPALSTLDRTAHWTFFHTSLPSWKTNWAAHTRAGLFKSL
ncbi:hypothetical protein BDU57DRAFT_85981 [Ampelomyces quisqualis]|uniref:Uncharacterized protein n=1 Tax=Ampelomyces quisqualis TaxID=50730 RepID=A0A6A5QAG8_AMPQU|nr:hypothetical protein BDU57DRAFT_85981 [Ampelomyces quisqualis]